MQKKFLKFLKRQKIITILLSIGLILIYGFLNLILLYSHEVIPLAVYCLITVILLSVFVFNLCYYRFFCRASYSISVQDGNVIFEKVNEEKVFCVSDCTEIKFYSQWVRFKFSNETIYLITYLTLRNAVFDSSQIDGRTARQIFTNAIIQY